MKWKPPAKGQTRREAGTQSHGPPGNTGEAAGPPKGAQAVLEKQVTSLRCACGYGLAVELRREGERVGQ